MKLKKSTRESGDRLITKTDTEGVISEAMRSLISPYIKKTFACGEACKGIYMAIHFPKQSLFFLFSILFPMLLASQTIDTIVVTATRSSIPLNQVSAPITVIDREQIDLSLAKDLSQILRFEAGLEIGRNGGPGQATSIFMRGTESNHTLVLIDGVRINPGTIGGAALQNISPEIIERIEIVKGARSSLYGTDAIGGVINVITKKVNSNSINTSVGYGSFNNRTALMDLGYANQSSEIGITVNSNQTDGYAIRTDSDTKRGYENLTSNAYYKKKFSSSDIAMRYWRSEGKVEYLDFFLSPLDQDYLNESTAFEINNVISDQFKSKILLSHIKDDIKQNQSTDYVTSKRNVFDGQLDFSIEKHNIAAGIYISDEEAASFAWGSGYTEDTRSEEFFVQDSIIEGKHRVFIATRYIDHETFGDEIVWNAEYGFDLNDRVSFSGSSGSGFRAPDATDRFGFGGNINLLPEESNDIQLSASFKKNDNSSYKFEIFDTQISNLIEYDMNANKMQNIGRASMKGMQIGYQYTDDIYVFRADLINQRAKNDITNSDLLRRADQSFTLNISRKFNENIFGLSLLASGERKDFGVTLPGYAIVNLTAKLKVTSNLSINAQIENITDKDYQTASNYRMQGASVFVDLAYNWQ